MGMLINRHRDRHDGATGNEKQDNKPAVEPKADGTVKEMTAYAEAQGIDLGNATKKAEIRAVIVAATAE